MAITWQNVKDLFYQTVGDTETSGAFFSEATVVVYADEAMREASNRTRFCDYVDEQLSVLSEPLVHLTFNGIYTIWRVEYDDEKLEPMTSTYLRRADRFWATREGTPRYYLLDEYATNVENVTFRLYETPSADDVTIRTYCYGLQSRVSNSYPTQTINVPEWFAYSLVFGMLHRAYEADTEMQSFEKAKFYGALWDDAILRLRVRSHGRLNKRWIYGETKSHRSLSIRNRLPEHIPEP